MDKYEDLSKLPMSALQDKLAEAQDDLTAATQERYTLIGKIMFYQKAAHDARSN